jgi:hypothetical protein
VIRFSRPREEARLIVLDTPHPRLAEAIQCESNGGVSERVQHAAGD